LEKLEARYKEKLGENKGFDFQIKEIERFLKNIVFVGSTSSNVLEKAKN
jgi:hypothetical protein